MTVNEAEQALAVPDTSTPVDLGDRAMINLLYSNGIRRAELAGLSIYDIDIQQRTLLNRQGKRPRR